MKRKNLIPALLAAAAVMLFLLAGCGQETAEEPVMTAAPVTAAPDPNPPVARVETPAAPVAISEEPAEAPSAEPVPSAEMPSAEPTPEPTPKATPVPPPTIVTAPVPTPTPEPAEDVLRPGTYEGADGSVLTVNDDGTCTLLTQLSGKVNGKEMSAKLTFHGVMEKGEATFDKVTYGALDLTAIAAAAGYTDASPWEAVAEVLYNLG